MLRRRELASPVRRLVALGVRKVGPPPVLRAVLPEDRKPREAQTLVALIWELRDRAHFHKAKAHCGHDLRQSHVLIEARAEPDGILEIYPRNARGER